MIRHLFFGIGIQHSQRIAGAECEDTNGVSLLPLFAGASLPERGLYWEHGKVQAYRQGEWKLMRFKKKEGIEVMLFNLARRSK